MTNETEARIEFVKAKQYHYDFHSRQFPITECAIQDCKKAVRRELRRQGKAS